MIKKTTYYELEYTDIVAMKRTNIPQYKATQTGYGRKIPLRTMLKLSDNKWHRVYMVCYSNNGTPYVQWQGKKYIPCELAIEYFRLMKGLTQ